MSKFNKKKKGELPPVSTASLPDIVFMLLFFFMVATVLRDNSLKIKNALPQANQVEKIKKDRTTFIYVGKPTDSKYGTESRIQINDALVTITDVQPAIYQYLAGLNEDFQDKFVVGLKVDKEANYGLVSDIKEEMREANALKVMYVTGVKPTE